MRGIPAFTALIWFIYLVMKPVYLFPKGLPQVSDIILILALVPGVAAVFLRPMGQVKLATLTGGLFAGLALVVNLVNYGFDHDSRFILASVYYVYNFLIFIFVVSLFERDAEKMIRITALGVFISLIVQFVSSEFFPDFDSGAARLTGGFSNPNQLAYWALLSAAMVVFLRQGGQLRAVDLVGLGLAGYIQTLALSKAGIIAYGVFLIVVALMPGLPRTARIAVVFFVMMGGVWVGFAPEPVQNIDAAARVTERLGTIGLERDDSLEGRGYTRIIEHPEYLLVGAGEGGFGRFTAAEESMELHSGLATILFSYGVLGLGLFGAFLFFIFHRQKWHALAILFCVLMFSMTSQTIRFTHTWVFLGVAYGTHLVRREQEEEVLTVPSGAPAPQES